jgi:hypothetical protein
VKAHILILFDELKESNHASTHLGKASPGTLVQEYADLQVALLKQCQNTKKSQKQTCGD